MLPSDQQPVLDDVEVLADSAEKMSAGASTFMLIRLTIAMSGFARRP